MKKHSEIQEKIDTLKANLDGVNHRIEWHRKKIRDSKLILSKEEELKKRVLDELQTLDYTLTRLKEDGTKAQEK